MKTAKLLLLGMAIGPASFAQDIPTGNVRAVVRNSFQQKFPKAADIEWEMKGSLYEVEFETGALWGVDHKAQFDASGKMIRHEQDINTNELPAAIKNSISTQFAGYRIDDADKIDFNGALTWEVELDNGPEEHKVTFDKSGKVLENLPD